MPPKKNSIIRDFFIYYFQSNKSICQCEVDIDPEQGDKLEKVISEVTDTNNGHWITDNYIPVAKKKRNNVKTEDTATSAAQDGAENEQSNVDLPIQCQNSATSNSAAGKIKIKKKCLEALTGSKCSNLKKHVRLKHPSKYNEYLQRCGNSSRSDGDFASQQIYVQPNTLTVTLDEDKVIDGIVKLMCQGGCRSFSMLEEEGFLDIFNPIFSAMKCRISQQNITEYIHSRYENIRSRLGILIENKLVSVKVDCATKMGRSFIGINIQFMVSGTPVVFRLAAIELKEWHTGETLKRIILDELLKFDVSPSQIYVLTSDSGSNLKKVCEPVGEDLEDGFVEEDESKVGVADEISNAIVNGPWIDEFIIPIKCAAHSLHLSVMDTLLNKNGNLALNGYLNAIETARMVVKELRTQDMVFLAQSRNLKKAILDIPTRWSSTFDMLESLTTNYKSFCETFVQLNPKLEVDEDTWRLIDEIISSLQPAKIASQKLLAADLTLTDVYRIVNVCQIETSKIGTALSLDLVDNFVKHRKEILESDVFFACMYLDPRFSFELNEEDKERGIRHLIRVYNKCVALQEDVSEDKAPSDVFSISDLCSVSTVGGEEADEVAERLYEKSQVERRRSILINTRESATTSHFETVCRAFSQEPATLKTRDSILKFWYEHKNIHPDLGQVAEILFAIPATQVSVEQLFSQIQFVFDHQGYNRKSDLIYEMQIVRNNMSIMEML